jgi:flagellin
MSFSIQTNVNSLIAQENLNTTALFQSQTIEQLTSGYRINSSGDDAAGLAVANQLAGNTAELTQGVLNANNSISQLQTIDGGLSNISTIIDRLRTLATESASSTFTGDRTTLNTEYQGLLGEITRQASNINLNTGGVSNADLTTYIGGGNNQANAQISVDLSGASNAVDATALGLSSTSVIGGGSNDISGAVTDLRSGTYLAAGTQQFTLNTGSGTITATVGNGNTAVTGQQAVDQLNQAFNALGITASIDSTTGQLSFSGGSTPYTVNQRQRVE